jgi:hypothetical protein
MTAGNFTLLPGQIHPYFPVEAQITGYLANKWNTLELLTMFVAGVSAIFGVTYVVVKRIRPTLSTGDLSTIMWFVMCGCIHSFFEGYFAYNFRTMGSMNDLFGQLWKEYSLSDSRYLTQDAFVLCMETVTAVRYGLIYGIVFSWLTHCDRLSGDPALSSPPPLLRTTTRSATRCSSSSRSANSMATFSTTRPPCSTITSSTSHTRVPRPRTTGATSS